MKHAQFDHFYSPVQKGATFEPRHDKTNEVTMRMQKVKTTNNIFEA